MIRSLLLVGLASLTAAAVTKPPTVAARQFSAPVPVAYNYGPSPEPLQGLSPSPAPDTNRSRVNPFLESSYGPSPVRSPRGPPFLEGLQYCFPGSATVELQDGSRKPMSSVRIGDRVKVADGIFSDVFMFTHKLADTTSDFLVVRTASGAELQLTTGHYLYVNGALAAAGTIRVGDALESAGGERTAVTSVGSEMMEGLYNPQTSHGDIIVNGIRASTFTTAVEPSAAQALLAPLRAAYAKLGFATSAFDKGANYLVGK